MTCLNNLLIHHNDMFKRSVQNISDIKYKILSITELVNLKITRLKLI